MKFLVSLQVLHIDLAFLCEYLINLPPCCYVSSRIFLYLLLWKARNSISLHPKLNRQNEPSHNLVIHASFTGHIHKWLATMADYLICIDFEATCYPSMAQRNKGWYQEILGELSNNHFYPFASVWNCVWCEILPDVGAVFVDLSYGEILSEFQSYVSPTEFHLTRGCYKKLGIEEETVDNASILPTVLSKFGRWMKMVREDYDLVMPWQDRCSGENAYFCTWSNMDLGYYLPNECNRKNLTYANYLKWWLNGQAVFEVR